MSKLVKTCLITWRIDIKGYVKARAKRLFGRISVVYSVHASHWMICTLYWKIFRMKLDAFIVDIFW